ncbi:MAG: hypothetical protein NC098_00490 [Lachnoclostridium sp.]|nr:hypothetical protein [Lachnoclostridium sp.]
MRSLLLSLLIIFATAATAGDDVVHQARQQLSELPLHPVEGLWKFPGEEGVIKIMRTDADARSYEMVVLTAPDNFLMPGTTIGHVTPTAAYGVYDATICTDITPGRTLKPSRPKKFVISLTDEESRIMMRRYGKTVKFKWWRLMPYMFRWTIIESESSRGEIDGLVRIYPEPAIPLNPVYL